MRIQHPVAAAAALLCSLPVTAQNDARSPLSGRGVQSHEPFTAEESDELEGLEQTVKRFQEEAAEYRDATRKLIEYKYKQKRDLLFNSYERLIVNLETEQRGRRESAIAKFESFLRRYPDDARYTPDAMFRLSELYFERSYDQYFQARQAFDVALEKWSPESGELEPEEPALHYEPTIAMMQRLITEFPDYRLLDGSYYLLGYCLGEQGEEERAVDVFQELVAQYPTSRFTPEVWTRIGEYYFASNELELALHAYRQVLGHVDSPFYDKAMYKLAWTHYRLADPERAPEEFQKAVDTFVELLDFNERTKAEGKERGGELRKESILYIAISYADEQWGGLDKMLAYLDSLGGKPYERELLVALGDVFTDQTRFDEAVAAYEVAQQRFPDAIDAPQVQEKIITAYERNRAFDEATKAREALSANYTEGSAWYEKHRDDEEAVRLVKELTRKSLYSAAVFHHKQAQIHKQAEKIDLATAAYREAAESYRKYIEQFPHDRQLYELTYYLAESLYFSLQFEEAAAEYIKVRDSNTDDKFREEAAYSVVLSYQNAIKVAEAAGTLPPVKVLKSTDRAPDAEIKPREIPKLRADVIDASDRYAAVAPNSERVPKVLYKAAEIYYVYDHLDEARQRFGSILEAYPQHEVAEFAANLIIESYLTEKNYVAVESFSRKLLERPATPGRKEFKGELVKFKAGAMFKVAEELDANKEYEKAAELYLKLLEENPENQFADSALNNAAVAFENAKRFESASKLYERLVREHPKSPLADSALFRVGLNAERFFDFDRAISAYVRVVDEYPKSERRADATYNAALSLENTQQYEKAAEQYLRYCKLFPRRDDAPKVCFRAGTVYGKMGDLKRVISTYNSFVKKYRKSVKHADRVIEASLKIAQAHDKLGREKEARKAYQATLKLFARSPSETAAPYAAEAQFQLVERHFSAFARMKISGTGRQQAKALKKSAETLKKVEKDYQSILKFKQIDWTLASLFRIGQLYQTMAESILEAPCPPDVKRTAKRIKIPVEEVCGEYKFALEDRAVTVEDKAVLAYETTISRARELQVANQWTKKTLLALNKLRRREWPLQKDAKSYLDPVTVAPPPMVDTGGKPVVATSPEPQLAQQPELQPAQQPDQQQRDGAEPAQPQPTQPENVQSIGGPSSRDAAGKQDRSPAHQSPQPLSPAAGTPQPPPPPPPPPPRG